MLNYAFVNNILLGKESSKRMHIDDDTARGRQSQDMQGIYFSQ